MKSTKDDEFFDDCPICQAQKRADHEGWPLTLSEYRDAEETTRRLGLSIGGGTLFNLSL